MPSATLLAVGPGAVALLGAKEPVSAAKVAEFDLGDSASLNGALQSLIDESGASTLDVILSDEVVKFFVVDPPAGLTRFSDLEAVASVRFEELFGFDAAKWRISADWRAGRRFMASAAPRWLLAVLDESARKVLRIEPVFVRTYNTLASREPLQWFVCRYPDSVTAANFDGTACHLVRSSMLEPAEPVIPWLQREALLSNRPLQRVTLMSSTGLDQDTRVPACDMRLITPPRHMQLLSAVRLSAGAIA